MGSPRDWMGRPGTPYDNVPDPSPFSEEVCGALEDMATALKAMRAEAATLKAAFEKVLAFRLPVGAVVDEYGAAGNVKVARGSGFGARQFRIDSAPFVDVNVAFPALSRAYFDATPIGKSGPMKAGCRVVVHVFPRLAYGDDFTNENDRIVEAIDQFEADEYAARSECPATGPST